MTVYIYKYTSHFAIHDLGNRGSVGVVLPITVTGPPANKTPKESISSYTSVPSLQYKKCIPWLGMSYLPSLSTASLSLYLQLAWFVPMWGWVVSRQESNWWRRRQGYWMGWCKSINYLYKNTPYTSGLNPCHVHHPVSSCHCRSGSNLKKLRKWRNI